MLHYRLPAFLRSPQVLLEVYIHRTSQVLQTHCIALIYYNIKLLSIHLVLIKITCNPLIPACSCQSWGQLWNCSFGCFSLSTPSGKFSFVIQLSILFYSTAFITSLKMHMAIIRLYFNLAHFVTRQKIDPVPVTKSARLTKICCLMHLQQG